MSKRQGVSFHHSSIESLPLERESVDAIMINQVLHHLPDGKEKAWQQHDAVMRSLRAFLSLERLSSTEPPMSRWTKGFGFIR